MVLMKPEIPKTVCQVYTNILYIITQVSVNIILCIQSYFDMHRIDMNVYAYHSHQCKQFISKPDLIVQEKKQEWNICNDSVL